MTTYRAAEDYCSASDYEAEYTWGELHDLILVHWGDYMGEDVPESLRELGDGRVVDADWDPAGNPNPTVYARLVELSR